MPHRRWPQSNFLKLCAACVDHNAAQAILIGSSNRCPVVTELVRDLKERSVEYFRISALAAAAYRSLHVGQLDMELLGKLVT